MKKVPEIRFAGFTDAWEQRKLGQVGSVSMCRRIFKEQTSESGDIPFYKIGTFGGQADAYISRELFAEYRSKYPYPKEGDILISASGSIGRTVEFTGKNEYFQDSNIVWLSDLLNSIQEIKVNSYSTCILCKYIVSNYYLEKQREKEQNRNKKTIRKKLNNLHYTPKPSSAKLSDISVFRPLQGGKCSPK